MAMNGIAICGLAAFLIAAPMAGAQPLDPIEPSAPAPDAELEESRDDALNRLHAELAEATPGEAEAIAKRIQTIWARSGSDSMDLLLTRGRTALQKEEWDKARAHIAALNRLAPDFAEGWNASATYHYLRQDFWRAAQDIEKTLKLEPRHFSAMTGFALVLEQTEQDAAALKAWREVEKLYPGFENARKSIDRLAPVVDGREL